VGVFDVSTSPTKERYAVTDDTVIKLVQPGSFEEVLRTAARPFWRRPRRPRWRRSWSPHRSQDGGRPCSHRASRPFAGARDPDRPWPAGGSAAFGFAIEARRPATRSVSASAPPCCRHTHGGPRASMCCCRSSTCGACRPATSTRGGPAGQERSGTVGIDDLPPEGDVERRSRRRRKCDLSARRYVYVWADGIYPQARL
jgi:hypothetical protein